MKKIVFYSLVLTLSLIVQLNAQLSPFANGLQKYRQGNLEGAIADFETVLTTDKENVKAKEYLLNCLIALATRFIQEKEYIQALNYLERALKLSPEDIEVNQLYQTVKSKVAKKVTPPTAPALPSPQVPKIKETKPTVLLGREKIIEVRKELFVELEEKMTALLANFDRERNAFQQHLAKQEEKEKRARKQFLLLTVLVLLVFTFIFLCSFYTHSKVLLRQNKILLLKEKECQIALTQSEMQLARIEEKFIQEKNIFNRQLEERTKQLEEKFHKEKNLLILEFEEKIKQLNQEKEKMFREINELQKINQELENQLQKYLKEKKQREEELRIVLFPISRQREDLLRYLKQWKIRQRNETFISLLKQSS